MARTMAAMGGPLRRSAASGEGALVRAELRAAVEAGMGATVISASVAAPSIEAGLLHHVPLPMPSRAFRALWHQERRRSQAAGALLDLIRAPGPG